MLYLKLFLFLSYCTIILDTLCTFLHIPHATWNFLHYHNLIDPIRRQSWNLRHTQCLSLYRSFKLCRVCLTVNFHLVNLHMLTFPQGTLRCIWWRVSSQDADYWKIVHTAVRPLICLSVWIPVDSVESQLPPFNSIRASSLEYIFSNGLKSGVSIDLRLADNVSLTRLNIFSTRCNWYHWNISSEFSWC